jgi:hypothetical protein
MATLKQYDFAEFRGTPKIGRYVATDKIKKNGLQNFNAHLLL